LIKKKKKALPEILQVIASYPTPGILISLGTTDRLGLWGVGIFLAKSEATPSKAKQVALSYPWRDSASIRRPDAMYIHATYDKRLRPCYVGSVIKKFVTSAM
jgi:hypothetical protein